jgi:hypothetical protein
MVSGPEKGDGTKGHEKAGGDEDSARHHRSLLGD